MLWRRSLESTSSINLRISRNFQRDTSPGHLQDLRRQQVQAIRQVQALQVDRAVPEQLESLAPVIRAASQLGRRLVLVQALPLVS
jgi:hypothetical protein